MQVVGAQDAYTYTYTVIVLHIRLPTAKIQTHLYALRAPCITTTNPNETFSEARTKGIR